MPIQIQRVKSMMQPRQFMSQKQVPQKLLKGVRMQCMSFTFWWDSQFFFIVLMSCRIDFDTVILVRVADCRSLGGHLKRFLKRFSRIFALCLCMVLLLPLYCQILRDELRAARPTQLEAKGVKQRRHRFNPTHLIHSQCNETSWTAEGRIVCLRALN